VAAPAIESTSQTSTSRGACRGASKILLLTDDGREVALFHSAAPQKYSAKLSFGDTDNVQRETCLRVGRRATGA
jgi:hypothetical protein